MIQNEYMKSKVTFFYFEERKFFMASLELELKSTQYFGRLLAHKA